MTYLSTIDTIITDVIAPNAAAVDAQARFPDASITAIRDAGLLGLISAADVGGLDEGIRAAATVIERIAQECGSTAMVMCMHYAGTAILEKYGDADLRSDNASGKHLLTLAFSETGSRSHFWAPVSNAQASEGGIELTAKKSWVTSANHATAYLWSSRPLAASGASSIWWVPRTTPGIESSAGFDGLGLRGNDSTPVHADGAVVSPECLLGADGEGLAIMLETVLPMFTVMTTACAVGLMEGATNAACAHAKSARLDHLDQSLAALPTIRAYLARMRIATDQARCLMLDTVDAIEQSRSDAVLRVLECKAAAAEAATHVLDIGMRVCGGAAFRKEIGVERRFRDARAGTVMAPTTDQLYDFIGKAICGMEVF